MRQRREDVELEIDGTSLAEHLVELDDGAHRILAEQGHLALGAQHHRIVGGATHRGLQRVERLRGVVEARRSFGFAARLHGRLGVVERDVEEPHRRGCAVRLVERRQQSGGGARRIEDGAELATRAGAVAGAQRGGERAAVQHLVGMAGDEVREKGLRLLQPDRAAAEQHLSDLENGHRVIRLGRDLHQTVARSGHRLVGRLALPVEERAFIERHSGTQPVGSLGLRSLEGLVHRGLGRLDAVRTTRARRAGAVAHGQARERTEREIALHGLESVRCERRLEVIEHRSALGVVQRIDAAESRVSAVHIGDRGTCAVLGHHPLHVVGPLRQHAPHHAAVEGLGLRAERLHRDAPPREVAACRARFVRQHREVLLVAFARLALGFRGDHEDRIPELGQVVEVGGALRHRAAVGVGRLAVVLGGQVLVAGADVALHVALLLHEQPHAEQSDDEHQ